MKRTKVGQGEEKYQIWGQKYDKDTDEKIGDKFEVTTSTYRGIAPEVELGSGIPLPAEGTSIEDVQAQAKELERKEAEANAPQPEPSPSAEPTPSVAPEPTPPVTPEQPVEGAA